MTVESAFTRQLSAALFGNEKLAEIALYMESEAVPVTAQMIANGTGFSHGLVRDVLRRLVNTGVLAELPRLGGSRSPLFYRIVPGPLWSAVVALTEQLVSIGTPGPNTESEIDSRVH